MDNFKNYSSIYNLIYRNKDYKKETNFIINLFKKFKFKKKNILEFGSGTGSHAKHFIKKGFTVDGIEKSIQMLSMCKKINGVTFHHGDICKTKLKKKFDIILSLFHVFIYQTNNNNIKNFFKNANYHLNKDGLLGFDFWYSPAVNFQKPQTRLMEKKTKLKK